MCVTTETDLNKMWELNVKNIEQLQDLFNWT